jgi:hypothetical protein
MPVRKMCAYAKDTKRNIYGGFHQAQKNTFCEIPLTGVLEQRKLFYGDKNKKCKNVMGRQVICGWGHEGAFPWIGNVSYRNLGVLT